MMDPRTALAGAVLAAATTIGPQRLAAQAQQDTFRLDELVVTATRLASSPATVPAAITVLEGETLRASGVVHVADALRSVPGLAVVRSGPTGALTSAFVRGAESDHVLVLVDGVPANDPGGAVDLANFSTTEVERIEVVRGPVSVLYGSDAAAGVIQIFTRRRHGRPLIEASLGAGRSARIAGDGASNSMQTGASLSGGHAGINYALTASRHAADGIWALNNSYGATTISGRFSAVRGASSVRVATRYSDATYHFPTDGAGRLVDANQFRSAESLSLGLEAGHALSDRIDFHLALTSRTGDYRIDDRPDDRADTLGAYALRVADRLSRRGADLWVDIRASRAITLTAGATLQRQGSTNETSSESSFGPYESASEEDRSNRGAWAQMIAVARSDLTLTVGGRIDDNARFGTFLTHRAGVNWRPAMGLLIRAAAGTGFKEPTFYENFAEGFVRGDPSLQPERTRNVELGIEQSVASGRLTVAATAFSQRMRNLIQFTFTPPSAEAANYFNIGEAGASGLELGARWTPRAGLSASASWDLLETEVTDEGFGSDRSFLEGQPLLRRPRHRLSVAAACATKRWRVDAAFRRTGSRADLDFSDPTDFDGRRVTLPAYATFDLAARYSLVNGALSGLDVVVRVDNLLDERYEEVRNFPAQRRAIQIGLRSRIGG